MILPNDVEPGKLIKADEWNLVLDALRALDDRLTNLESQQGPTGEVIITGLDPIGTEANPIRPQQPLRIHGRNFRFSVGAQRVFLGGVRITSFNVLESGDTLLVVTVPAFPDLPEEGDELELRVENGTSEDTRSVWVQRPPLPISGDVDILWDDEADSNPIPNPIPAEAGNTSFRFLFNLRSRATRDATFLVQPTVSITEWQNNVRILDEEGQVVPDGRIELAQSEIVPFEVEVHNVSTGETGTPFTLNVMATAGTVHGAYNRELEVGVPVEAADPTIILALTGHEVFDADGNSDPSGGEYVESSNTINLRTGRQLFMYYQVTFEEAGQYEVTVTTAADTAGWEAVANPTEYTEDTDGETETPLFAVTATDSASQTGSVTFQIRREGAEASQTRRYNLSLLDDTNGG